MWNEDSDDHTLGPMAFAGCGPGEPAPSPSAQGREDTGRGLSCDLSSLSAVPPSAGYSMFAIGIGALLFGCWRMIKWNRQRR
jgi:hypothetical protein